MLPAAKGFCRFSWLVSVPNVNAPLSLTASWCSSSHGNVSSQTRSTPLPGSSLDNFLPPPDMSHWDTDPQAAAKSLAKALSPTHRTVLAAALVAFHQRDGPDAKAHADRLFTAADTGSDSQLSRYAMHLTGTSFRPSTSRLTFKLLTSCNRCWGYMRFHTLFPIPVTHVHTCCSCIINSLLCLVFPAWQLVCVHCSTMIDDAV